MRIALFRCTLSAIIVVTLLLSNWQYKRYCYKKELSASQTYTISGFFLNEQQLLLANQLYNGQPGYKLFTAFKSHDGQLYLVNRGFIASNNYQITIPQLTSAQILEVLPYPISKSFFLGPAILATKPYLVLQRLEADSLAQWLGGTIKFCQLVNNSLAQVGPFNPLTTIPPAKHLSYAVQWLLLSALAGWYLFYSFKCYAPR